MSLNQYIRPMSLFLSEDYSNGKWGMYWIIMGLEKPRDP
jgi:hypothetical protein